MQARIIHSSLNARGGSERLALATIVAVHSLGFNLTLETAERPDFQKILDSSGVDLSSKVSRQRTLRLITGFGPRLPEDLYINTHGDMIPYFKHGMTPANSITYCHFPIAGPLIASEDKEYDRFLRNNMMVCSPRAKAKYREKLQAEYVQMLENSKVITNSQYSKNALSQRFQVDAEVLPPPVDVRAFQSLSDPDAHRLNRVLVVSRFHPSKRLENAIHIAALMKQKKVAEGMSIVGNLSAAGLGYFNYIRNLISKYDLADFVEICCNVEFSRLVHLMKTTSVYLHPLPGEPFGIATVEAMSAGMIPVVHKIGGHTEFVPQRYWFDDFGSAVEAIDRALRAPLSERNNLSIRAERFSVDKYESRIKGIIGKIYDIEPETSVRPLQEIRQPLASLELTTVVKALSS
ncbi:MAG: glycosyltransferase [Nitrososphaera sp.]